MAKRKDCPKKLLTKINNVKKSKLKLKESINDTKTFKKENQDIIKKYNLLRNNKCVKYCVLPFVLKIISL